MTIKDKPNFYNAIFCCFLYFFIGTVDNLTGLQFEKLLSGLFGPGNGVWELIVLLLYCHSYLYGALFCAIFGASDFAFVFCQIIVFIIFTALLYHILTEIKSYKTQKRRHTE